MKKMVVVVCCLAIVLTGYLTAYLLIRSQRYESSYQEVWTGTPPIMYFQFDSGEYWSLAFMPLLWADHQINDTPSMILLGNNVIISWMD